MPLTELPSARLGCFFDYAELSRIKATCHTGNKAYSSLLFGDMDDQLPSALPVPNSIEDDEDEGDPFAFSEDMEILAIDPDDDDTRGMMIFPARVHGPSQYDLSESCAHFTLNDFAAIQAYDFNSNVPPNKTVRNAMNKLGKGASASPNSAVCGETSPGSKSVLASATCNK